MPKQIALFLFIASGLFAQERKVEPTWLYRDVSALPVRQIDLSSDSCHYTAIFGEGDTQSKVPKERCPFWGADRDTARPLSDGRLSAQ